MPRKKDEITESKAPVITRTIITGHKYSVFKKEDDGRLKFIKPLEVEKEFTRNELEKFKAATGEVYVYDCTITKKYEMDVDDFIKNAREVINYEM